MKETTVKCDACEKDLTDAFSVTLYRLVLYSERMPTSSSVVYDRVPDTIIRRDCHFCSLKCLALWSNSAQDRFGP